MNYTSSSLSMPVQFTPGMPRIPFIKVVRHEFWPKTIWSSTSPPGAFAYKLILHLPLPSVFIHNFNFWYLSLALPSELNTIAQAHLLTPFQHLLCILHCNWFWFCLFGCQVDLCVKNIGEDDWASDDNLPHQQRLCILSSDGYLTHDDSLICKPISLSTSKSWQHQPHRQQRARTITHLKHHHHSGNCLKLDKQSRTYPSLLQVPRILPNGFQQGRSTSAERYCRD